MKKNLIIIITILPLSCDKNNDNELGVNIDISYSLSFYDKKGMNLLDPNNSSSFNYNHSEILLFYKENNKIIVVDRDDNLIVKVNDEYSIRISSLGRDIGENQFEVFLKLDSNETDKIKTEVSRNESGSDTYLKNIWYNDKLIWSLGSNNSKFIKIIK